VKRDVQVLVRGEGVAGVQAKRRERAALSAEVEQCDEEMVARRRRVTGGGTGTGKQKKVEPMPRRDGEPVVVGGRMSVTRIAR